MLVVAGAIVVVIMVAVVAVAVVVGVHFKNEKPLFASAEWHSQIHLSGATSESPKRQLAGERG